MRKWGIVITVVYALIVVGLVTPGSILIIGGDAGKLSALPEAFGALFAQGFVWAAVGIVVCGEAALLFLRVDTTWRHAKPRAHILVSCAVAGALTALLTAAAVWSIGFAARGDDFANSFVIDTGTEIVCFVAALWLLWGIVFYMFLRRSSDPVTRVVSWLLRGSVLELLIAVPCHIIARRRDECSAPQMTSFGIATGIAIMLLSFGPSVLLLYKKRLDEYPRKAKMPT
ncbi:MAG: hypothetical protein ABSA32_03905 [Candidatus Acidiferrales bacterium]|jgi:hypothetical protein